VISVYTSIVGQVRRASLCAFAPFLAIGSMAVAESLISHASEPEYSTGRTRPARARERRECKERARMPGWPPI
jgi:hypothetical protein